VIVLSDGADTSSFLRPESVLETARRSDAVVYGISASPLEGTSFLRDICAATGGRVSRIKSTDGIREAFLRVLEEFRHRYLLSYVPQGVSKGGWHKLAVRVKNRHAAVKARPGYLAGP
jgi:VWFA-related protein